MTDEHARGWISTVNFEISFLHDCLDCYLSFVFQGYNIVKPIRTLLPIPVILFGLLRRMLRNIFDIYVK